MNSTHRGGAASTERATPVDEPAFGRQGKKRRWDMEGDLGLLRRVWDSIDYVADPLGTGSQKLTLKLKLLTRAALKMRMLRDWACPGEPGDVGRLRNHLLLPIWYERPYISSNWSTEKKLEVAREHRRLASTSLRLLELDDEESVSLIQLGDISPNLELVLDSPRWFRDEGDCALNLFKDGQRIVSIAFSVATESGKQIAYIGALQGGIRGQQALDINKELTKAAHGLRPRDLLLALFVVVCDEMKIAEIRAVSNRFSLAHSEFYDNKKVHVDYDTIWLERGGVFDPNTGFFRLSGSQTRDPSDIPSKKRSMYRRRNEMLVRLKSQIGQSLSHYAARAWLAVVSVLLPAQSTFEQSMML